MVALLWARYVLLALLLSVVSWLVYLQRRLGR